MPSTEHSAWALLPADLWRRIMLVAAPDSFKQPTKHPEDTAAVPWLAWRRLVANMELVCGSMRDAVAGPGAKDLWESPRFRTCYAGLSLQQSQGLIRLQLSRCQELSSLRQACIWGGSWSAAELYEVCTRVPKQLQVLDLYELHDAEEAGIVSLAIAGASVKVLLFRGSAPVTFPVSTQVLMVKGSLLASPDLSQAQAKLLVAGLLSLPSLRILAVSLPWVMTAQDVHLIRQVLPELQTLELTLYNWPLEDGSPCQQAVQSLKLLETVQVGLCTYVWNSYSSVHFLQQVHEVPLTELKIVFLSDELSPTEEALLAKCCSCGQLKVHFKDPARRLKVLPAGVDVVYI